MSCKHVVHEREGGGAQLRRLSMSVSCDGSRRDELCMHLLSLHCLVVNQKLGKWNPI